MNIQINTPQEVKQLLLNNKINPAAAIHLIQIMMSMIRIKTSETKYSKDAVVSQIEVLLKLENPLSFWQTTNKFNVKEVFRCK
jgi:hypothetical protein